MPSKKNSYKILSVGGSIIIPPTGFDISFLKKFRELIVSEVKKGQRFILVIGGGATCRQYQKGLRDAIDASDVVQDWIGIYTTQFNAQFVRLLFGDHAHNEIITNPTKKTNTKKSILVAAGWKPGTSTDGDAVLLAKTYGAKEVINLSNVDYVYDKDPRTNPGAKKFDNLTWKEFRKIVGDKWTPGANVPFDPVAAKEADKLGLTVKFVKGTELEKVRSVLNNTAVLGTVIY
ncbi:MAG: UMP kinase [Candidatus Magasanikbacteria bacterium]|nr:UMP kinase [Candidatus Magasanikbacteria bacterium]